MPPAHRRRRSTERARSAPPRPGVRDKRLPPAVGRPAEASSEATASRNGEAGTPGAGRPVRVPTRTCSRASDTARPRPSTSPCARTLVTASMSSRREGAASPRSAARSSASRAVSAASPGPAGNPAARRARVMEVMIPTAPDSRAAGSRPDSRTSWRHPGSRMPEGYPERESRCSKEYPTRAARTSSVPGRAPAPSASSRSRAGAWKAPTRAATLRPLPTRVATQSRIHSSRAEVRASTAPSSARIAHPLARAATRICSGDEAGARASTSLSHASCASPGPQPARSSRARRPRGSPGQASAVPGPPGPPPLGCAPTGLGRPPPGSAPAGPRPPGCAPVAGAGPDGQIDARDLDARAARPAQSRQLRGEIREGVEAHALAAAERQGHGGHRLRVGEPVHPRPRLRGQLDREHVRAETVEQAGDGDGQRGRVVAHPDQERRARGCQRRDLPVRAHTRRPRHCSSAPRSPHSCSHVRIPCAARRLTTESQ